MLLDSHRCNHNTLNVAISDQARFFNNMSALAEYLETNVSAPHPHLCPLSVTAYHRMGEEGILDPSQRTELIDGKIIAMAPIGSKHADWVDRLTRYFIKTLPDNITVRPQNPIYLDEINEPEPDIALLRPRDQPYRDAHPRSEDVMLVIEIADTSLNYDRDVKVPLYAKHGIPEVWLVDAEANRLEIYREPAEEDYRLHLKPQLHEAITLCAIAKVEVDLGRLF